jgi:hypothetical protein
MFTSDLLVFSVDHIPSKLSNLQSRIDLLSLGSSAVAGLVESGDKQACAFVLVPVSAVLGR